MFFVSEKMPKIYFIDEAVSTERDGDVREASAGRLPQTAQSLLRTSSRREQRQPLLHFLAVFVRDTSFPLTRSFAFFCREKIDSKTNKK